ncbi:hypothetical protein TNIN_284591 [Trichonephila inaurata madagascariensis]|uniref:Uncharacterized protein n=1 Tax=Trichonephila inaurata madagascariensis TaxID=2747483 RepID=A0A8X6YRB4_9ARAC|nr:hypothetical protein TNIN_284591 [Trichonephila inaurata madagascariensis]
MPERRKGSDLGRRTTRSTAMRNRRAQRTDEQIPQDNEDVRVNMAQLHETRSQEARAEQNQQRHSQLTILIPRPQEGK